jgi:hypothetical protein
MSGALEGQTAGFKLNLPAFDWADWGTYINANFTIIDSLFRTYVTAQGITGVWTPSTIYAADDRVLDLLGGNIYICQVSHTSGTGTFADDQTANPTYWRALSYDPENRGEWLPLTAYTANDFVVYNYKYCVVNTDHTSSTSFDDDVAANKVEVLIDLTDAAGLDAQVSADQAAASAAAAAGSASSAATSASTALTRANTATTQANTATTQATNAAASASAASTSASSAAASAVSAQAAADSIIYVGMIALFAFKTPTSGWLKCNGGTIGNAASGASARANADTVDLFTALWNDTTNSELQLYTSAGATVARGASAAADFAANRRLALPDLRGEFVRGWDDAKGTDSGRVFLSSQAAANEPHTHTGTTSNDGSHNHDMGYDLQANTSVGGAANRVQDMNNAGGGSTKTTTTVGNHNHTFTTASSGSEGRPRNIALSYFIRYA